LVLAALTWAQTHLVYLAGPELLALLGRLALQEQVRRVLPLVARVLLGLLVQ
jgi:hypothetical protein